MPDNKVSDADYAAEIKKLKMEKSLFQEGYFQLKKTLDQLKKSEERVKELNEVRNKFIMIVSHQLRTPLTAVNWNLEMILNGEFGKLEETQHSFLQATHSASIEITHRISSLLTAMDIEEGRITYETGELSISGICAAEISGILKKCELKNIICVYTPVTGELPPVQGDNEKLRMAIHSLLENAVDYTKDSGKINISLQLKKDAIRFEVADTGIGIPQSEQHLIFTRFFRASNAFVMRTDAFGLGLYVAKHIIDQHRGKIGFKSKEGIGSTFWFEIPIKQ